VKVFLLFYEQPAVDPLSVQPAGDQMANTVGVYEQPVQPNVVSYTSIDGISAYSVPCNVDLDASGNIVEVTPFLCNDDSDACGLENEVILSKLARKGTADRKTWKRNAKALKRMQAYGKVDSPESRNVVVAGKPHLAFFD